MTSPSSPPEEEHKPAPPGLRPIQALVNTRDLEAGTDMLEDDDAARRWLAQAGLVDSGDRPSPADLRLLREVREALRALIAANGDQPSSSTDLAPLRMLVEAEPARLQVGPDGRLELEPDGGELRARLLGLLLRVRDAQLEGSWERLKLCANPECRWAFFDRSRNHRGAWCRMEVCGNRLKNRRLRARRS